MLSAEAACEEEARREGIRSGTSGTAIVGGLEDEIIIVFVTIIMIIIIIIIIMIIIIIIIIISLCCLLFSVCYSLEYKNRRSLVRRKGHILICCPHLEGSLLLVIIAISNNSYQ